MLQRLLTFETFLPKKIGARDVVARAKGLFVVNNQELYLLNDGNKYKCDIMLLDPVAHPYKWSIFFASHASMHVIILVIDLAADLSQIDISYDAKLSATIFTTANLFASDTELLKLATRISRQLVSDLRSKGNIEADFNEQLYVLAEQLHPKVVVALEKLNSTT